MTEFIRKCKNIFSLKVILKMFIIAIEFLSDLIEICNCCKFSQSKYILLIIFEILSLKTFFSLNVI